MAPSVGVLTFHRCINYGSYWQARCLVEGLRGLGHDAVLLDHDSAAAKRAEWRCALAPLLPEQSPASDRALYRAKVRSFQSAVAALPLSQPFDLASPGTMAACDLVVVGSDEVWNLRHPWYGGVPAFFGSGLPTRGLVSYAASFGNHDAAEGLGVPWRDWLARFACISVRDANSSALVRVATSRRPVIVLDPCLQFPPRLDHAGETGNYLAVYGHGFPCGVRSMVRAWAGRHGCAIRSVGYRNDWADEQHLAAGPHDFAAHMAGARAVVTNFFHGCVFALLQSKPFACSPSAYRFNKVRDLSALLGLGERLVDDRSSQAQVDALLGEPPGDGVMRRIGALRAASFDYLDRALH
ncbi:polysaccharide pyruvyl transferase family protein [Bosea sp. CS1GBMeth4]|uniref:polysaccharide pyruvyl transferase family protein n=1 Tax=Bosea sp. CS1GBMeth4 TaxID=1892849 RepID=UPI00164907E8|nr:polysaccharide pyruvyl transferase family protein [Bosea sp. CS1GBMeth4]